MKQFALAAAAICMAATVSAAPIIMPTELGDEVFDTNNFATSLAGSSCSSTCLTFGTGGLVVGPLSTATIEPLLVGASLAEGVALGAGVNEADYVIPSFGLLASIANGAGADFVIWEAGSPAEQVLVSVSLGGGIFSPAISYLTAPTTTVNNDSGFRTNAIHINLDDFGLAPNALIDQVRLQGLFTGVGGSGPDILAIAAINAGPPTVPEPAALALFGAGLLGVGLARRRRNG